jgi:acetyltransferase-like isoleucine patch superfamily enzyme
MGTKFVTYLKFVGHLFRHVRIKVSEEYYLFKNYKNRGTFLFGNNHVHNATIGEHSYISYNSIIRNCDVGKYCSIGPNVVIGFGNHRIDSLSTHPSIYMNKKQLADEMQMRMDASFPKVMIENDVWIGSNVYIKNGVTISNGSIVGAGSVVLNDVPPYAIVGGVPAKIIRFRFEKEVIEKLLLSKWWEYELNDMPVDLKKFENEKEL